MFAKQKMSVKYFFFTVTTAPQYYHITNFNLFSSADHAANSSVCVLL